MCAGAIMNARVSNIYFGMFDDEKGCCGSLYQICRDPRFNHQSNVTGGIMELDCAELLKSYLKSKRQ
jgi:tRNA(adenine34) deaminase